MLLAQRVEVVLEIGMMMRVRVVVGVRDESLSQL
jgi:hypothetical protein